jgi:hypothetical protein
MFRMEAHPLDRNPSVQSPVPTDARLRPERHRDWDIAEDQEARLMGLTLSPVGDSYNVESCIIPVAAGVPGKPRNFFRL